MDTKRMIMGMLLITALGLGWQYFLLEQYKKHPEWKRLDQPATAVAGQTQPSASTQPEVAGLSSAPSTQPTTGWVAQAPATSQKTTLGSKVFEDPRYRMALDIDPAGASVDWVALNNYRQEVDSPDIFTFQMPYAQEGDQTRSLSTVAITIDGTRLELWDKNFVLRQRTDHSAQFVMDFAGSGGASVELVKEYVVEPAQSIPTTSQGYEVHVNYSLLNLSKQKHTASLEFNGPTVPRAETARQETEIVAGYDDDGLVKIQHQPLSSFSTKNPSRNYVVSDDKLPVLWVGATSNYFNAIVRPDQTNQLTSAQASAINADSPTDQRLVSIRFSTINFDLAPGGAATLPLKVFFGPKVRALLNSHYYSSFPLGYDDTLIMVSTGICGFCTFPWLISILVTMLAGLHWVLFRDWGLAIIALVCGVRLILHPITKRSQVSMMKMQKLSPEIERLKKKFGDDKEGFGKAQMELYKTVGFTPVLGCLPMFLQMPIFIALWRALQTTFELRQAPFLEFFGVHFTWIHDLSLPDNLVKFATPISLPFGWHLAGINVLPLAMAVVTFVNQKYFTPRPAAATPEQQQQQQMMTWMTLVFPFMFYTFPSGLNLYYLTSTTLGILESKRIRDHIKKKEEQDALLGPVIVDAGKMSRSARRRQPDPSKPAVKKSWLEKLQEKAEEVARRSQQQKKKR